jgi:hypothetical protein
MKNSILIFCLFLSIEGSGQKADSEYKSMIDSALLLTAQKVLSEANTVYLLDDRNAPYVYGNGTDAKFKTIDLANRKNFKVLKKGIHAWKIIPVLKNNKLSIGIVDFTITYRSNNYNFANGGGSETTFEYSCIEKKWILIDSKYRGI